MKFQITLAAARVNAGYYQKDAAYLIGVTTKTLRNYENGINTIPAPTLRKAARVYGIPEDLIKLPVIDDGGFDENFLDCSTV